MRNLSQNFWNCAIVREKKSKLATCLMPEKAIHELKNDNKGRLKNKNYD